MDHKAPIRSAIVSRLPKFGDCASAGCLRVTAPTRPNGKTTPPPGPRPNGLVRNSSSSSHKWRREGGSPTTPPGRTDSSTEDKTPPLPPAPPPQLCAPGKEVRSACTATAKLRRPGASLATASCPTTVPKQASKAGTKLPQSGPKVVHNGSGSGSLVRPVPISGSESRPGNPGAGPGSSPPRGGSLDGLSRSGGPKTPSLDPGSIVRSHSFSHVRQIPSPIGQPTAHRSLSFSRAVERAQPLTSTQLRPPGGPLLRPLGQLSPAALGGGLTHSSILTPPPPSAVLGCLRKPLLPGCVSSGALGLRLAHPGQAKGLSTGRVKGDVRSVTAPTGSAELLLLGEAVSSGKADPPGGRGCVLEPSEQAQEDMSLSLSLSSTSASSLERGDTSEESPDDLDSGKADSGAQSGHIRHFLDQTRDWSSKGLAEPEVKLAVQGSQEGADSHQCSSLEMSPSNSSGGGIYMWDEEGLEPLGGAGTHPCDSYNDSDLNGIDILKKLETLGNEQLEDDDLMLDVGLPEHGLHDTEAMAHIDRSERAGRHGHWRRKQLRWNGQDHFHNDNRAPDFQHCDDLTFQGSWVPGPRSLPPSVGRDDSLSGPVDELSLKHMSQDCVSLRNQLLRLKNLLQLEDAGLPADIFEENEDNATALQLEDLRKEVQVLREELRSRDETIARLTLQCEEIQHQQKQALQGCTGRCQGQHQRATSALRQGDRKCGKRVHHQQYDKATQTHCRAHNQAPHVLQPSSLPLKGPLAQERLVKALPTEAPSDLPRRCSAERVAPVVDSSSPGPLAPDLDKLNVLLSAHLHLLHRLGPGAPRGVCAGDSGAPAVLPSGLALEPIAPAEPPLQPGKPGSHPRSSCPRMLQPPRLHRRLFIPLLPPPACSPAASGAGLPARPMPPPSRGLPSFSSGARAKAQPQPQSRAQPQPQSQPQPQPQTLTLLPRPGRDFQHQRAEPGAADALIGSSHPSRLPKPKIH